MKYRNPCWKPPPPRLQPYHPTTFLERGVAVPFTTPMLASARARPMERGGTELIVPNPSGGDGVYVLPWNAVCDLCRPTMHDTQLNERVAELSTITPHGIRMAARAIAADGLAGRPARAAATEAATHERLDQLLTNFLLLLELVKQGEPAGHNQVPPDQEQPAILERRARWVIGHISPRLGLSPDRIANGLEQLAAMFSGVGIGRQIAEARLTRLTNAIARLQQDARSWSESRFDDSAALATMIAEVAGHTLACAASTLGATRKLVDDLPMLLRNWDNAPDILAQRATRPDWLLDGWEQICLLWDTAETDALRRAAMAEMALMVPVIPREAAFWMEDTLIAIDPTLRKRNVKINEDWRTGITVFDQIARNERIRALAA